MQSELPFIDYPFSYSKLEYPSNMPLVDSLLLDFGTQDFSSDFLPVSNEAEMKRLEAEIQEVGTELRMLGGSTSTEFMFFPDMFRDTGWGAFPVVDRSMSCPPFSVFADFPDFNVAKNKERTKPAEVKGFVCSKCPKAFARRYGLASHMQTHLDVMLF
jgi:hypothetical protein